MHEDPRLFVSLPLCSLFFSTPPPKTMAEESKGFEEPEVEFFFVRIVVHEGKFRGIRGAILHQARKLLAYRKKERRTVVYGDTEATSSDIYIEVYFRKEENRTEFYDKVRKAHRIPGVLRKCFPDYKPTFDYTTYTCILRDSQLTPIFEFELQDMFDNSPPGSIDYDIEVQSLGSYYSESPSKKRRSSSASSATLGRGSGQLSASTRSSGQLEVIRKDDPLFVWQTLERNDIIGQPFRCHLIDKKYDRFRAKNDNNNFLAGSAPFHQLLDGLNLSTPYLVPGILVEFDRACGSSVTAEDGVARYKVFVRIRFLDDTNDKYVKDELRSRLKQDIGCMIFEDGSARTSLHVLDVEDFRECLEHKGVKTNKAWRLFSAGRYKVPSCA